MESKKRGQHRELRSWRSCPCKLKITEANCATKPSDDGLDKLIRIIIINAKELQEE